MGTGVERPNSNEVIMKIEAAQRLKAADHQGPIHHDIYITLKDGSKEARAKQLELGEKYLTNHPGAISYVGTVLATNLTRHKQKSYLYNEDNFDVSFHMIFVDAKAHNAFQVSERHVKQFIPQSAPNWTKIRVFDSVEEIK